MTSLWGVGSTPARSLHSTHLHLHILDDLGFLGSLRHPSLSTCRTLDSRALVAVFLPSPTNRAATRSPPRLHTPMLTTELSNASPFDPTPPAEQPSCRAHALIALPLSTLLRNAHLLLLSACSFSLGSAVVICPSSLWASAGGYPDSQQAACSHPVLRWLLSSAPEGASAKLLLCSSWPHTL